MTAAIVANRSRLSHVGRALLRTSDTTYAFIHCIGSCTTNQSAPVHLSGCTSIQLHADAVLSMSIGTDPQNGMQNTQS